MTLKKTFGLYSKFAAFVFWIKFDFSDFHICINKTDRSDQSGVLIAKTTPRYWMYNDMTSKMNSRIIRFWHQHAARRRLRLISTLKLFLRLLRCGPNSANKNSNCASDILKYVQKRQ